MLKLDYTINRDIDRMEAVRAILAEEEASGQKPTSKALEQMANYVMYGKDEKHMSAVDKKLVIIEETKYGSFKKGDQKVQSLDALLEEGAEPAVRPIERSAYKKTKPTIKRPSYGKDGEIVDRGDSDIPGMEQLWESIDRVAEALEDEEDPYSAFKLRHMLIDIRKHQYYLKDAYRPAIHFLAVQHPSQQLVNWSEDAGYTITPKEADAKFYEEVMTPQLRKRHKKVDSSKVDREDDPLYHLVQRQTFDYENPIHIRYLLDFYGDIMKQLDEKPDSYGRALLFDLEYYVEKANLTKLRYHLLLRKVDHWSHPMIKNELREKFNVDYDVNHISAILNDEIPAKIARAALEDRIWKESKNDLKECKRCGKKIPRNALFFSRNASHKDGFASRCKECEKAIRIEKGRQGATDRRLKENKEGE